MPLIEDNDALCPVSMFWAVPKIDVMPPLPPLQAPARPLPTEPPKYCAHRCSAKRERKNWNFLTAHERSLYIEAVQELYNAGVYIKFVKMHQDAVNDPYAHGTSGFLPWHRKFLLEYENALRCLAPKYACTTPPHAMYSRLLPRFFRDLKLTQMSP